MADGSISGNSGKAVEESEKMTLVYYPPSPTFFSSLDFPPTFFSSLDFPPSPTFFSSLDFPPSPPVGFPLSPPPPSSDAVGFPLAFDGSQPPMENPHQFTTNSLPLLPLPPQNQQQLISPAPLHPPSFDSRPVLPLAFDESQSPMENPHQFTTNSLPLLPPPPQNQQQVISPAPQHQDNVFPQYLFAGETAALQRQQLLEYWTDALSFSPRRRMMMKNCRVEQRIPIPRKRMVYIVLRQRQRQRHGGDRVAVIRLLRHRLGGIFDTAEEAALAYNQVVFKSRGKNARLNFPRHFRVLNRAAESTAPTRTEFPSPPAQQRNPEEDPGSGRSEAMVAAVDNEVEGLGWGSGTGEGVRRKILEIENKKTRGVRITIPLEDILKYSEMRLVDAAENLNVSQSTLKRNCRDYGIPRWPPRSNIIRRIPQLNSNYLQLGPNQASSSSTVVHPNLPQLSCVEKQPDTDPNTEMQLSSFKQPNDGNIVTIKARYVNNLTIRFPISLQSSGLVELEQQVAKRLDLEAGTYYIKYKDEENDLILIACDEDFQDYVRLKGTSLIEVFLEPKHAAN